MKRAFTLVELLVVISIIGLLAGLLLPAVNAARESGRRTVCINHQRNIATALITYENAQNAFPGWRDFSTFGKDQGQASWVTGILQQLELNALYDKLRDGSLTSTEIPRIPILNCPSGDNFRDVRTLNYVVNGGSVDDFDGVDSVWTSDTNAYNGVFIDRCENPTVKVGVDDISKLDGTSYTLLLCENLNRGFWISTTLTDMSNERDGTANPPTPPDNLASGKDMLEGSVAFCWPRIYDGPYDVNDPPPIVYCPFQKNCTLGANNVPGDGRTPRFINVCVDAAYGADWYQSARPSSRHPGVVVVTFCDQNSRPLNEKIAEKTFVQLMTGSDQRSDARFTLNGAGYLDNLVFNPQDIN